MYSLVQRPRKFVSRPSPFSFDTIQHNPKHGARERRIETVEHVPRNNSTGSKHQHSIARRGSLTDGIDGAFATDRRGSVRDLEYRDHRDRDHRADEAKGRDPAAFNDRNWCSANFTSLVPY
jgi:hypothetical protein